MEEHIFFEDKKNQLKGPFTERQIQEWYRKSWFDGSFKFYLSDENTGEADQEKEFTLASLISLNGKGCPFFNFPVGTKLNSAGIVAQKEENLSRIEKEIADLRVQCEVVVNVEKRLLELENRVMVLETESALIARKAQKIEKQEKKKTPVVDAVKTISTVLVTQCRDEAAPVRPSNIGGSGWEGYYELAERVMPYVVESLDLYTSGNYKNCDGEKTQSTVKMMMCLNNVHAEYTMLKRNEVMTYYLIEEIKHRDYFCCFFCNKVFFNYKQILFHLLSEEHFNKEPNYVMRYLLTDVTLVLRCFLLLTDDSEDEEKRLKKNGKAETNSGAYPTPSFLSRFRAKYDHFIKKDASYDYSISMRARLAVQNVKGTIGRQAMIELDQHIGDSNTACLSCGFKTGNREDYYKHLISAFHMREGIQGAKIFDLPTILVNVYRKDLV